MPRYTVANPITSGHARVAALSFVLLLSSQLLATVASGKSIAAAEKDSNGFLVHEIETPYQSGKTLIRVLIPDRLEKAKKYPTVYVLPVEAGNDSRFGNGLLEMKKHDLHNKYQAVF
ncbi:MAG: hypothetical protein JNM56_15255, partial [Planctomycetia bacterium]|nr:hypothetical protein [Planctomycetia bacterium]